MPPNRYVFRGAEVYNNLDSDTSTDDSSAGSSSSLDTLEQDVDVSLLKSGSMADNELDIDRQDLDEDTSISSNAKHDAISS